MMVLLLVFACLTLVQVAAAAAGNLLAWLTILIFSGGMVTALLSLLRADRKDKGPPEESGGGFDAGDP